MCKFNPKNDSRRIDPCMVSLIDRMNRILKSNVKILACCCGHGKYPMTIILKRNYYGKDYIYELISGVAIERKKKFYVKDKQGVYYIPEVSNER